MTNDKINIAIAGACGEPLTQTKWSFVYWRPENREDSISSGGWDSEEWAKKDIARLERTGWVCRAPSAYEEKCEIADYANDLNACRSMENKMTEDQKILYRHLLSCNSDGPNATYPTVEAAMCHATAEQRCHAFLKVMGGWTP